MSAVQNALPTSRLTLRRSGPEKLKILLIDDDQASQQLCTRFLRRDKEVEYAVTTANSADGGMRECSSHDFDCVLIDYYLPDSTGTTVLREINQQLGPKAPPSIILSAGDGEQAATSAVRAGAYDFLAKKALTAHALTRAVENAVVKNRLRLSAEGRQTELAESNKRLLEKSREVQRFYQSVSHEVKTPLAAAREFIALTLDGVAGEVNEKQRELLMHAIDSCDQITAHFNDLLEITRLDARKVRLDLAWSSMDSVFARCLASASAAVEAKQLYVQLNISKNLPKIRFDTNKIVQVVANLIGNAVKFSPAKSKIVLSAGLHEDGRLFRCSVQDFGCGIHESEIAMVFERLYQTQRAGEEQGNEGLGLGLSISKEIVQLHGGRIWVESFLGRGSTFSFELPVQGPGPE